MTSPAGDLVIHGLEVYEIEPGSDDCPDVAWLHDASDGAVVVSIGDAITAHMKKGERYAVILRREP